MPLLIRWVINALALMLVAYLVGGIHVQGFFSALVASALIGLLNAFLRPLLIILTLPLTILTLGLFAFVINALMLLLASSILAGFQVDGFGSALWGALLLTLVSWLIGALTGGDRGQGGSFTIWTSRGRRTWTRGQGPRRGHGDGSGTDPEVIDLDQDEGGKWS